MLRVLDDPFDATRFYHGPTVENHDVVSDQVSGGQVVSDIDDGDAKLAVQFANAV